jgi:DNA polymerase-4/DNA polymerase V
MIAQKIGQAVETELGITVSIGASLSKVLAKIGSKHNKPHGITLIPGRDIHLFLNTLPIQKVWGIGPNTAAFLRKFGITTALEFARKDEGFIQEYLSKPFQEIWHELNGESVYPVVRESKSSYQSISKTKTFTPPSSDKAFIYGQLVKNLENACIKARRYNLAATRLLVFLRRQDFRDSGVEMKLSSPSAYPVNLFSALRQGFVSVYTAGVLYRLTGVVLAELVPEAGIQRSLFDDVAKIDRLAKIYSSIDQLSEKFGKHVIQHAASLPAKLHSQHEGERGAVPQRKNKLFRGENKRQRLGLPVIDVKLM